MGCPFAEAPETKDSGWGCGDGIICNASTPSFDRIVHELGVPVVWQSLASR